MSLATLLALSAALHLYIGARIVPDLPGAGTAAAFTLLLIVSALFVPMGLLARRVAKPPVADTLAWVGLLFMGLFSSLLVATVLRDALLLLASLAGWIAPSLPPLDGLDGASAAAVPLLGLAVTVLGFLNARRTARVVTIEIPVADLPQALHGYRIVQISDIHVGPTIGERYVEAIVEAVNRLQARHRRHHRRPGGRQRGRAGQPRRAAAPAGLARRQLLRHRQPRVLLGRRRLAGPAGAPGHPGAAQPARGDRARRRQAGAGGRGRLQRRAFRRDSIAATRMAAIAGAPADAAIRVLLAHQPRSAPAAARAGFDLQLSGHTHGGQFLPWNFLVPLQQPFTAGLHAIEQLRIYVSRGTGYWGPPKRFGAPSEITEVRLVPAV